MSGGPDQDHSGPAPPPGSSPLPRQGPHQGAGPAPYFGPQPPPGRHPHDGGSDNHQYYNPYGDYSGMPRDSQRGGWQGPGNNSNYMPRPQGAPYQGMDGYQGGSGPDPGILVYDNVVTGDPSTVMIGEGNRAGGRVKGRISGNRIIRS